MSLRSRLSEDLKTAMKAGEAARVSTIRLVIARIKDADIAARPKGGEAPGDEELVGVLRSMVKQRHDSVALYRQGRREDLAAREEAEIALIETYLPPALDDAAMDREVARAIEQTSATSVKDLGRVMAVLKAAHGATLDMARASQVARDRLG